LCTLICLFIKEAKYQKTSLIQAREQDRGFSSSSSSFYSLDPSTSKLNPWYITGFADGESSFVVSIVKSNVSNKWNIQAFFSIRLHSRDIDLLHKINSFFGVGKVYIKSESTASYVVSSIKDIYSVIIPHFDKYPLHTRKQADFLLFKSVLDLINKGEHLTPEGFNKILGIKCSLNKGLNEELTQSFPNVKPVDRPVVEPSKIKDSAWLSGFVEAEGCFYVSLYKSVASKTGYAARLEFILSQHNLDQEFMKSLVEYLGCGYIKKYKNKSWVEFVVAKSKDVNNIIIPLFIKYPLQGTKKLDFADFVKVAELMKVKAHLTKDGIEKIQVIKKGMNKGR